MPEYEIIQWSEIAPLQLSPDPEGERVFADRVMYFDVNAIPYTAEAYRQKKYAFVSDYARFWIMYQYGGIYFDTDVEVIKPLAPPHPSPGGEGEGPTPALPSREGGLPCFMGFEVNPDGKNTPGRYAPRYCFDVALGLGFGLTKGHPFMKQMMEHYQTLKFELPPADITWYKTIVAYTTEQLCALGLENKPGIQCIHFEKPEEDIYVYPSEYFAPINVISGRLHITENTCTIHRYAGSWYGAPPHSSPEGRRNISMGSLVRVIKCYLPEWVFFAWNKVKRRRYSLRSYETEA